MGDPQNRTKRSQRRKRNYIAKTLWEDRRFKPKTYEVRKYEDEDWKQELKDYLSEDY